MAFQTYRHLLEAVTSFKYLGSVLTESDNYWLALVNNMKLVRKKWARFYRILGQEGDDAHTSDTLLKVVVQATLFGGVRNLGEEPQYWTDP